MVSVKASSATYGGELKPPELFAVVDRAQCRVLARCLPKSQADVFCSTWGRSAVAVREKFTLPPDDQVLSQLQ